MVRKHLLEPSHEAEQPNRVVLPVHQESRSRSKMSPDAFFGALQEIVTSSELPEQVQDAVTRFGRGKQGAICATDFARQAPANGPVAQWLSAAEALASSVGPVLDKFVSGWSLSGITYFSTGSPQPSFC